MALKQISMPHTLKFSREDLMFAQSHAPTKERIEKQREWLRTTNAQAERELDEAFNAGYELKSQYEVSTSDTTATVFVLHLNPSAAAGMPMDYQLTKQAEEAGYARGLADRTLKNDALTDLLAALHQADSDRREWQAAHGGGEETDALISAWGFIDEIRGMLWALVGMADQPSAKSQVPLAERLNSLANPLQHRFEGKE